MQINNLYSPEVTGEWGFNGTITESSLNWRRPQEICSAFRPFVRVNMTEVSRIHASVYQPPQILLEQGLGPGKWQRTYKRIAQEIDPNFLRQGIRAEELAGSQFVGFKPEDVMNFHIPSAEYEKNRIKYTNSFLFEEWEEIGSDAELNFAERARMLLWVGDMRLHCTCPSFLYWGYQYICTQMNVAIYPEDRFPRERNPGTRGIVCKHLNRTLRVLPFHSGDIAKEIRRQFG